MSMSVSYKKLWKLLIDRDMSKSDMRAATGIAASTVSRMNKNEPVSLDVLEKICKVLKCDFGDIISISDCSDTFDGSDNRGN